MSNEKATLSIAECAEHLGIGRTVCYELARTGQLPTIRLGGRLLVSKVGLARMLEVEPQELTMTENLEASVTPLEIAPQAGCVLDFSNGGVLIECADGESLERVREAITDGRLSVSLAEGGNGSKEAEVVPDSKAEM